MNPPEARCISTSALFDIIETAKRMGRFALSAYDAGNKQTAWSFLGMMTGLALALHKLGCTDIAHQLETISVYFFDPKQRGRVEKILEVETE